METGHNSNAQLKAIVERIEAVETEMRDRMEDRKEIYLEAKSNGYDVPTLRAIVRARREDPDKRRAREEMFEIYSGQLGLE